MSTRHLVDPQLLHLLDGPAMPELTREGLVEGRARSRAMAQAALTPPPDDLAVEERYAPGPDGAPEVRVLVYRPKALTAGAGAILHIHGGGYIFGSPEMSHPRNVRLSLALSCVIVSVDYRLAPETPFPGPLEDCYAALQWLHGEAQALGVDLTRIAIAGESAGGGLAAALALLARDRGGPAIVYQSLIYPMVDDRTCCTAEPHPFVGEFVWTPARNHLGWSCLLGAEPGGEGVSPYAAAARAEDLSGLPPAYIATGALDLFLEEDLEYARRLARAGVPVELHVYPGAFHGFQRAAEADVVIAAQRDHQEALRRALA